jgi:cell division protein FtsB
VTENASLASKIKEISDVGRTAATQLDQQADASAAAAAVVAKVGPSAKGVINIKEMNHTSDRFPSAPPVVVSKKRGRTDSTVTSVSAKNSKAASSSLSRDSAAALKKLIKTKAPTKKVSMAVAAVVVAEMPSVLPDQDSFGCDGADGEEAEEQQDEDTEEQTSQLREAVDHGTISSVKRRRVEQVEELANLGYDIHGILFSRECEVREEVSNEMGLIICGLNKELNEERDKIHSLKHGHATDFSKSCKKVKRAQLDAMEARRVSDAAHDLRLLEEKVAEDEQAHAEEVAALQTENCALKARNAQLEAHITALLQKEAAPMPTAMAIAAAPAQTSQTETEYSRRFGKRNDENAALSNALGKPAAIVIVKSPLRAPLSPLSKHMDNKAPVISPVFVKHSVAGLISAYSSGKPPVASAKKEQNTSPQRVRGAALAAGLSSEQPVRVTRQKAAGLR